jgi:hypothetical protein
MEQIALEDLADLSLEELEELLLKIYASVERTVDAMSSCTKGVKEVGAPFITNNELERSFQERWELLKVTVNAIIYHAVFSDEPSP